MMSRCGSITGSWSACSGPSGCGKTTTLRLIAGFLEPSDGEIHVGDRLVSSTARTLPPEQRKMSMIFQSYALWPHMTVAENIVYGLRLRKLDRDTIAKKLAAILATTKLEILAQRYPGELSGGQQQRVALARALVVEPETLLLDEPLVQPRRQSARGDALRDPPAARRISLHHGLRHPRPVRGDDHRRPDRGHERRQDRPARHAGRHLRPAAIGIRRALHRRQQRDQGHRARRQPHLALPARPCRWSARN